MEDGKASAEFYIQKLEGRIRALTDALEICLYELQDWNEVSDDAATRDAIRIAEETLGE